MKTPKQINNLAWDYLADAYFRRGDHNGRQIGKAYEKNTSDFRERMLKADPGIATAISALERVIERYEHP